MTRTVHIEHQGKDVVVLELSKGDLARLKAGQTPTEEGIKLGRTTLPGRSVSSTVAYSPEADNAAVVAQREKLHTKKP